MMGRRLFLGALGALSLPKFAVSVADTPHAPLDLSQIDMPRDKEDFLIGFGSCLNQSHSQEVFRAINSIPFDYFVFMGDNVYSANYSPKSLAQQYKLLSNNDGFLTLKKNACLLATWDDHDFGVDDGQGDYKYKDLSLELFRNFWGFSSSYEPKNLNGVYGSQLIDLGKVTVQVILLDCRFNKSLRNQEMLGQQQWDWLYGVLGQQAHYRIVISSIQCLPIRKRFESWTRIMPERRRILDALTQAGYSNSNPFAPKTVIISGDRHLHEYIVNAVLNPTHFEQSDAKRSL